MIKRVFPILALATFSSMLGHGIVVPLLPIYADSMGASGVGLGVILAGFSLSRIVSMPIFGRISDRKGRKLFIVIGLLSYAIISPVYTWADTVFLLVLIRFLHGVAGGMVVPIAQAYIGDISPEGEEGKWMGYTNAAFFSGFGVGPLMGGVLTEYFGMDVAFLAMGGFNLLAFFIAVFFLPESSRKTLAAGPHLSYKEISNSGIVKGLFSHRLSFSISRAVFITFIAIFAVTSLGLSLTHVGILLVVRILLQSLLAIPAGKIADRFNKRALVIFGTIISFTHLALVPLSYNFWQLLALSALGGLGGAISMLASSAMTVEEGRKYGMGSAIAIISMALSLGMILGPILGGVMVDLMDVSAAFYFGAIMALLGAGSFIWFTRHK